MERIAAVRDGETILIGKGSYGVLTFSKRVFKRGITIDADGSTIAGVVIVDSGGIKIRGGTIVGAGGRSTGVRVDRSSRINIESMSITALHRGIVVNESSEIELIGNQLFGLQSDGIDIALSRRVRIINNTCRDFRPVLATFDAAGKRVSDGDHPDCIQAWSRPTSAPTADLEIVGNSADGIMQGIFLGNHIRNGADDGGFDRIQVRNNRLRVGMPNGISLYNVRGGEVTGNAVSTYPNSRLPKPPYSLVRARISIIDSQVKACGNRILDWPISGITTECAN